MTKNEIIAELFVSDDFNKCIRKMEPANLRDDLKAEVALILCEKDADLIIGLHERKELTYYTVRIIINMIQSKTSPFYKKFRAISLMPISSFYFHSSDEVDNDSIGTVLQDIHTIHDIPCGYDDRSDRAIEAIDDLYWYTKEILKLYGELGTYRAVEEATGIPFESIYKTVQKGCKEIRKRVA
jgi:hypothetical protein